MAKRDDWLVRGWQMSNRGGWPIYEVLLWTRSTGAVLCVYSRDDVSFDVLYASKKKNNASPQV